MPLNARIVSKASKTLYCFGLITKLSNKIEAFFNSSAFELNPLLEGIPNSKPDVIE